MKNKKIIITILTVVCCVIFLSMIAYIQRGKILLDNSASYTIKKIIGSKYIIREVCFESLGTDLTGYWWISLEANLQQETLDNFLLYQQDETEFSIYKKIFAKKFSVEKSLDSYQLYRFEMPLGDGSICSEYPCNIYVLAREGEKNIFLGISKN